MISALKAAAAKLAVVAPDIKAGSGKALEGLVLFSLAQALADHRAQVSARDSRSYPLTGPFILRGGPGHLVDPKLVPAGQPCFFAAEIHGQTVEIHNSLEFVGSSSVEHEMDVSVVWRHDAEAARTAPIRMIEGPPLVGVELKELSPAKPLDKNIPRAFVACILDLIPHWAIEVLAIGRRGRFGAYGLTRRDDRFWIITSAEISDPSRKYAESYDVQVIDLATPAKIMSAAQVAASRIVRHALFDPPPHPSVPMPPPSAAPTTFRLRRRPSMRPRARTAPT
ncbi:hypothetical protein CFHF_18070 [Caulobacter flavus]|uniref:RES domain-containing protein n=1 Tax=Caulobacter flavus TaxID=1679497 RepID=A0A2N5CQB0_9CAUL|nr:hypothetical protein [Caulobacter flavus]AYV46275.1 hypothetical protein C1707_08405 [Caulobacter flavus]PLR09995.1 hypothetical protein CFHF_18070 [Caulobacter flavus]